MVDKFFIKVLHSPLRAIAKFFSKVGISANMVTLSNVPLSILIFVSLLAKWYMIALILIIINRIFDGLDGAIARYNHTSNPASGYLDIMVDYLFYISIPLAFVLNDPQSNAIFGSLVLGGFVLTGVNFMATSSVATKLNIKNVSFPNKAIYYASNIVEGAETILYFILVCIFPQYFAPISMVVGILLFVTTPLLVFIRWKVFSKQKHYPSLHA